MSVKRFSFFATPTEFYPWINTACEKHSLSLLIEGDHHFEETDLESLKANPSKVKPLWSFYVGKSGQSYPPYEENMNPNRWGLVTVEPPKIDGDELLLCTISSKSDWPDEDRMTRENKTGHQVFGWLRREMRKHLENPTWVRLIGSSGPGTPHSDVWFSKGAAKWHSEGGKLKQPAVANIEFFVETAAD
jgi:hypothetical protein